MSLKTRIEQIIEYYKFGNPNDFANKLGIKPTKIYNVLEGKTGKSYTLIEEISNKLPTINKQWLESGIGEMLNTPANEKKSEDIESLKKEIERLRKLVTDLQAELLEIYKKK
jgi:polyhydroxyalkanoate synthesis regulator phasin